MTPVFEIHPWNYQSCIKLRLSNSLKQEFIPTNYDRRHFAEMNELWILNFLVKTLLVGLWLVFLCASINLHERNENSKSFQDLA